MPTLYLAEHGAVLGRESERLHVSKDGARLLELPLRDVSSVVLLSTAQVTSQALAALLENGVELAVVSPGGKLLGQLVSPKAKNILIRKEQYRRETDPAFVLLQAAAVVHAKLHNSLRVLVRHRYDHPEDADALAQAEDAVRRLAESVLAAPNLDALRGLEGAAAAAYWGAFGLMLRPSGMPFDGRRKRPPPDPVNAVLSFGYTLLSNLFTSRLDAVGLDPYLGFLHEERYGRPSLALDLIEPFRAPLVDRFALKVFNLKTLGADDFQPDDEGGVRMQPDALKRFFAAWHRNLERMNLETHLRACADDLIAVLSGQKPVLSPWRWDAA